MKQNPEYLRTDIVLFYRWLIDMWHYHAKKHNESYCKFYEKLILKYEEHFGINEEYI